MRDAKALGFESKVLAKGVARTHALESLVICSFLRGLSVRDVEAALQETFEAPVVSKSTVAWVCRETAERYRAWCARHLDEHDVVYLPGRSRRLGGVCFVKETLPLRRRPQSRLFRGRVLPLAVVVVPPESTRRNR